MAIEALSLIKGISDDAASIKSYLSALVQPIWQDVSSGRLRVVLDPAGGAQTLGTVTTVSNVTTVATVTTVSTLTSMSQIGGVAANSFIYDQMHSAWALSVRMAVT